MPQSLVQVWLHVVFSTRERRTFLKHADFRDQMFRMLAHEVKETGCVSATVGGHVDHVHLLVGLTSTIRISDFIRHVKTKTSFWAKSADVGTDLFSWQRGYGALSVSHSNLDSVDRYIREQAEHHRRMSFQDEFRLLCQKHGVEIDERYVWD